MLVWYNGGIPVLYTEVLSVLIVTESIDSISYSFYIYNILTFKCLIYQCISMYHYVSVSHLCPFAFAVLTVSLVFLVSTESIRCCCGGAVVLSVCFLCISNASVCISNVSVMYQYVSVMYQ